MKVRDAVASDAPDLATVHVRGWQSAYRGIIPDPFLDSLDPVPRAAWFEERIEAGDLILAGESDDEIVGFCFAGPAREVKGWAEVYAIYLLPRVWGSGLGASLLRQAEGRLISSGFDRALLWVLVDNPRARAFYERMGWHPTDEMQTLEIGGRKIPEVRYDRVPLRG